MRSASGLNQPSSDAAPRRLLRCAPLPDGRSERLKVRSMVGLLPLCAVTSFDGALVRRCHAYVNLERSLAARPEIMESIQDLRKKGCADRRLALILNTANPRRVPSTMLDENEFSSPYSIRSLSRYHADHPYIYRAGDREYRVSYLPTEVRHWHVRRQL